MRPVNGLRLSLGVLALKLTVTDLVVGESLFRFIIHRMGDCTPQQARTALSRYVTVIHNQHVLVLLKSFTN